MLNGFGKLKVIPLLTPVGHALPLIVVLLPGCLLLLLRQCLVRTVLQQGVMLVELDNLFVLLQELSQEYILDKKGDLTLFNSNT